MSENHKDSPIGGREKDEPVVLEEEELERESEVQMMELVTSRYTMDSSSNDLMDIKPLLEKMDICTCACAEKHTGVNCVTVSMSDVVFEYFPKCGELLELTARPVFCGNTSLDVSLDVIAEGQHGIRHRVCEAVFTYVTTRGPNGEKRFCPPLGKCSDEKTEWDRKLARHRKSLLKMEQAQTSNPSCCGGTTTTISPITTPTPAFDLEITEVVLPAHQNHMDHTFGGVVMAWMAKAALAVCARKSKRSAGSLLVRSVLRVDFRTGSETSDHLLLRTRLTAIFDEGRSAEVEVRVCKKSISSGHETSMNIGYFYVSGAGIGTGTDIPFNPNAAYVRRISSSVQFQGGLEAASWRRRLLLARRQLLGGLGDPVEWHPSLHQEAPLLTIESVLRLVHHRDYSVFWRRLEKTLHINSNNKAVVEAIEWTPGEAWGRSDTFVLRVRGMLQTKSLQGVLETIKSQRPQWDSFCQTIEILERGESQVPGGIQWDIVQHQALIPSNFLVSSEAHGGGRPSSPAERSIPFCYLRASKVDATEGTAILAMQSVLHPNASQTAKSKVRPSGWFMRAVNGGVELTYIVEHDLNSVREIALGMSDEDIVETMGVLAEGWYKRLDASFED